MDAKIETTLLTTDEACVAEVRLTFTFAYDLPAYFTGRGYAKKHPKDRPDRVTGATLAYARAFRELSEDLERVGRGRLGRPVFELDPSSAPFASFPTIDTFPTTTIGS